MTVMRNGLAIQQTADRDQHIVQEHGMGLGDEKIAQGDILTQRARPDAHQTRFHRPVSRRVAFDRKAHNLANGRDLRKMRGQLVADSQGLDRAIAILGANVCAAQKTIAASAAAAPRTATTGIATAAAVSGFAATTTTAPGIATAPTITNGIRARGGRHCRARSAGSNGNGLEEMPARKPQRF